MKIVSLLLLLTLADGRLFLEAAPEPASVAATKPLDYRIIVTGGELLEGAYPDAHTHFLTRTLRPLGARCVGSINVDDEPNDFPRALRFATNQVPLVIVTGGLGPTPNDIARETLAVPTRSIGMTESVGADNHATGCGSALAFILSAVRMPVGSVQAWGRKPAQEVNFSKPFAKCPADTITAIGNANLRQASLRVVAPPQNLATP